MEKDIKQVFCKKCGGLKSLRIEGKKENLLEMGCVCKSMEKTKISKPLWPYKSQILFIN